MRLLLIVTFVIVALAVAPTRAAQLATPLPTASPPTPASPSPSATPVPAPSESPGAFPTAPSSPGTPPPLTAQPLALNLHPADHATVTIADAVGFLSVTSDTHVVTFAIDQNAHAIAVTASGQTGRETLHVTDANGTSIDIPVRVAFNAGTIEPAATLQVTGNPLDVTWLNAQIAAFVRRITGVAPGATPQFGAATVPATLAPGFGTTLDIPIRILGGDQYYDVSGVTELNVKNVADTVAPYDPPLLFYDDDPERLLTEGVLFSGRVALGTPIRLYYYHDNGSEPRRLVVALVAQSQDPTSLQIIDASAGPNIDVLSVGHAVTRDFLTFKPDNVGVVLDLPQGEPYVLHNVLMQHLDGAAGNVDVRVTTGGPINVYVLAVPAALTDQQLQQALPQLVAQPLLPGDGHHRAGVFDITPSRYGTETLTYSLGGADAQTVYGQTSPPSADPPAAAPARPTGRDAGDYGVLHAFTFNANNPTAQPATAYLYEQPMGGVVRSSFLVNGTLVQIGCARVSERYLIAPVTLAPNQTTQITVQTMTDGGSNYPLQIGLTATPPLSSPPPISSPNGCFPKPGYVASPSPSPTPSSGALPPALPPSAPPTPEPTQSPGI